MEQNEIDNLMKGIDTSDTTDDENITWDNVQEELEASKKQELKTSVSTANFEELQRQERINGAALELDFVLDIPLTLNVELGRCRMLIGELLQLGQGSVVELVKYAGEPMDVFVNQRLIARGEVVVVNEKFGVRLTDIVSPAERVSKLK
jgi:flagellar motor switch protein FliN